MKSLAKIQKIFYKHHKILGAHTPRISNWGGAPPHPPVATPMLLLLRYIPGSVPHKMGPLIVKDPPARRLSELLVV